MERPLRGALEMMFIGLALSISFAASGTSPVDCERTLNAAHYAPQLWTWVDRHVRDVFRGGLEIDSLGLRPIDPRAHAAWSEHTFGRLAGGGHLAQMDYSASQIIIRDGFRPGVELLIVGDRLSWDPATGRAPTGSFFVLADSRLGEMALRAGPRLGVEFTAVIAGRHLALSPATDDPAERLRWTLRVMHEVREDLRPSPPVGD